MQVINNTHTTQSLTKAMRWSIADKMAEERLPLVNSAVSPVKPRKGFYSTYIKRLIDIIVSLFALIVTLPVNIIIACVTLLDVGRPIFFVTERCGKNGKIFRMIKFRNMTNETDDKGELLPPSQRLTKCGRFIRKTSFDELLNFWSVLKGDMSLIGPRPLPPEYLHRYNDRHKMRLCVRPGLECPQYKRLDHAHTWHEQFENDVWYVENISFKTDCIMLLRLFMMVFDKKTARARGNVQRMAFMGYSEDGKALDLSEILDDIDKEQY